MLNAIRLLPMHLASLKSDKRGVTAIEYALIAALIAIVIIGGVSAVGGSLTNVFNNVASAVSSGG
jgi:pilus assembly protein Flp/PilA